MEDIVIVETKDYAQVVFDNVDECYTENRQLECLFTLNELLKPDSSDIIGLYKVGFTNCKDYYTFQTLDLEQINAENKGKIVFDSEKIPKDDGEFYQFVYVSQGKQIRGASIPFQFKRTHLSDLIQVEDQEAVIIKSKESAINDTIVEMKSRCVNLSQANETYEKLIKENEDLITILKDEVTNMKMKCLRLTMDNDKINFALKSKSDKLKTISDTAASLNDENMQLKTRFDEVTSENHNLIESLQRRIAQVAHLKNELESLKMSKGEIEEILNAKESELTQLKKDKEELNRISDDLNRINDQIVKLEKQVDERVEELTKIKSDLRRNESLVETQAQTIQTILGERDILNLAIQKLNHEKSELESIKEFLSQELSMSKDKLLAADQCKEMLRAQLISTTNDLDEANLKLKKSNDELNKLTEKDRFAENDRNHLIEEISKIKNDYDTKLEQSNGSYFALNLAHAHLESRMKTTQQKHEAHIAENKQTIEKLNEENDNLKERLRAGAYEYSCLNKKYLRLKNLIVNTQIKKELKRDLKSEDANMSDSVLQDKTMSEDNINNGLETDRTLMEQYLNSSFYSTFNKDTNTGTFTHINNHNHHEQQQYSSPLNTNSAKRDNIIAVNNTTDDELVNLYYNNDIPVPMMTSTAKSTTNNNNNGSRLFSTDNNNTDSPITPNQSNTNEEIKNCEICGYIFPTDVDFYAYEQHLNSHYGPSCPLCFLTFRKGYPQPDFENHVNSHFTN